MINDMITSPIRRIKCKRFCKKYNLHLTYKNNNLAILHEIFHDRVYADYFPFYKRATIVDIGAHKGYFSLFASRNAAKNSTIIALEPSERNFTQLTINLRMNDITNVIQIHAGIAAKTGKQKLYLGLHDENDTIMRQDDNRYVLATVFSLEDLLRDQSIEIVDFLKIDCEGAEYDALYSTDEKILRIINVISLEFHDVKKEGFTGLDLAHFLKDVGFSIVAFHHDPTCLDLNYGKIIALRKL